MEKIDEDDMEDTQNTNHNGKMTDRGTENEEQKVLNDWQ